MLTARHQRAATDITARSHYKAVDQEKMSSFGAIKPKDVNGRTVIQGKERVLASTNQKNASAIFSDEKAPEKPGKKVCDYAWAKSTSGNAVARIGKKSINGISTYKSTMTLAHPTEKKTQMSSQSKPIVSARTSKKFVYGNQSHFSLAAGELAPK